MNKTMNFTMFVIGAVVGSVITWQYTKKKYEQIAQEEIDSVKEVFSKKEEAHDNKLDDSEARMKANQAKEKPGITEYTAQLHERGYTNYSNTFSAEEKKEENKSIDEDGPYVIAPEEFGELDNYEKISLTYYSDHVLTDDYDEIIDDVEDVVGFDSLNHFGEYEDDSVFVRNDKLKHDYEILLDQRKYSDIIKKKPHQVEV